MVVNSLGGTTLLLFLLFIAPGLLGLKTRLWVSRRPTEYDRIDIIVFSVIFSISSLILLYLSWSYLRWEFITGDTVRRISLAQFLGIYILHVLQCLVIGVAAGSFAHNYIEDNRIRDLYNSWEFAFQYVHSAIDVDVKTSDGHWIRGHVIQYETTDGVRDLILSSPRLVDSPEADKESGTPLGENVYLDEPDILRVVFHEHSDEDPDSTVLDADRIHMKLRDLYKASNLSPIIKSVREIYRTAMSIKTSYMISILLIEFLLIYTALFSVNIFTESDLAFWYIAFGYILGISLYDTYYQDGTNWMFAEIPLLFIGWMALGYYLELSIESLSSTGLAFLAGAVIMMFSKYATFRYSAQPAWILGFSTTSIFFILIWFSIYEHFSITPVRELILIAVISTILLFCERMHSGVANKYDNWPMFFVDCVYYVGTVVIIAFLLLWPYGSTQLHTRAITGMLLIGITVWIIEGFTKKIRHVEENVEYKPEIPKQMT